MGFINLYNELLAKPFGLEEIKSDNTGIMIVRCYRCGKKAHIGKFNAKLLEGILQYFCPEHN